MREHTLNNKVATGNQTERYYSAEFSVSGLDFPYQFRIWNIPSRPMCVLLKEGSDVLPRLKVGDTLNVKYYSNDRDNRFEYFETEIRDITKSDQGRFKGHYLVGLEII